MTIFRHKRVAIDFDGTLVDDVKDIEKAFNEKTFLNPKVGASKVTQWLKSKGFEILIFTCRPDYHRRYMEEILDSSGIEYDYILFYTKPRVDLYIDDKGFRFTSWAETEEFIEGNL